MSAIRTRHPARRRWPDAAAAGPDPLRHRPVLTHVYLVGGTEQARRRLAGQIHDASPLACGAILRLDATRDDAVLRSALERWIVGGGARMSVDPLTASSHGTLFIDRLPQLSRGTQRLLLLLAEQSSPDRPGPFTAWGGRLVVGSPCLPEAAVASGLLLARLHDCVDKLRVDVGRPDTARASHRCDPFPPEDHAANSLCG